MMKGQALYQCIGNAALFAVQFARWMETFFQLCSIDNRFDTSQLINSEKRTSHSVGVHRLDDSDAHIKKVNFFNIRTLQEQILPMFEGT